MAQKEVYDLRVGDRFRWRGRTYIFDRIMSSNAPRGNQKKGSVTVKVWVTEGDKSKQPTLRIPDDTRLES